ncbi:MAG: FMN-binding protein [Firmicutes bacterium]|nr:FMN-binding protein [Bacillota bacterium]MBQ6259960.1 FMN-binding protein [Bacillota bacterium]MBR0441317.1 FMN-binding protein [Bacillota bacterium]
MTARRNNPLSSIVVLCSICLVVSLLMTLCYQATEEHIESNRERRLQAMMLELLPDADAFEQVAANLEEGVSSVWKASNGAGWIVTSSANGYQGRITVMTGIRSSGKISKIRITDIGDENPGIAGRVNQSSYLNQYSGASGISSTGARAGANHIEAVSGATYSSSAVFSCVSLALMQIQEMEGGDTE